MPRLRAASPYLLAATLTTTGVLHFATPGVFNALIPRWLPGSARTWVYGSGVAELACAAGLYPRATRRPAATATAVLLVAVFPGNIEMAVHPGDVSRWIALARLPLQVPLVLWALQVRRASAADARSGSPVRAR